MQHLLGTCCSNVAGSRCKANRLVSLLSIFHLLNTLRNNALKWFKGRLRQIQPWLAASLETTCNLFPAQASTFSLASVPWKAKLWGWRPDGMDAGAARLWTTRGKQRKRDNKTRHCTPLQSTILHMSSIRTKLLNYIQLFQLGTFPE